MIKPKLLLHACCGVCSAYVPELLMPDFDVTIYYENSNIYPQAEYFKRLEAARTMAHSFDLPFIEASYDPPSWFKAVRGLWKEEENGHRCKTCIFFRLDKTFSFAVVNGFDAVATTLSVSRRKNVLMINEIGEHLSQKYDLEFVGKDWKKNNGEAISQKRAVEAKIYRQNYCGCVYSAIKKSLMRSD